MAKDIKAAKEIKAAKKTAAKTQKVIAWEVTQQFKNEAIDVLSKRPFVQVSNLINVINQMGEESEEDLNKVLSELGQLPYAEVVSILSRAATELCKPVYDVKK